ncbi:MAG: glycosyltransferase family 2 protein [Candidatus Eremiobacteraeota bacterium]|nr:glycosyltransferase family 2 protein [Candidatus Eremiobacteraeota bacterium]
MRFDKLTVVMTLYNYERFAAPCLDAYVAQTVYPFEILLVDDGSEDGTPAILREYAERYPDLFRVLLLPHVGLNPALTVAMKEVKTEFIYPAAADDFPRPGMIQALQQGYEINPNAGLVTMNYDLWLDDGRCLPDREPKPFRVDSGIKLSRAPEYLAPDELVRRILKSGTHPIGLAMYRLQDWLKSPAQNRNLRHYQDFLVNYSHALRGGIVHFPEPQLDFRLAVTSYGNQGRYNSLLEIATCRRFLEVLCEPGCDDIRQRFLNSQALGFLGWRLFLAALSLPTCWPYLSKLLSRRLLLTGTYLDLCYLLSPIYRYVAPYIRKKPGMHNVKPS